MKRSAGACSQRSVTSCARRLRSSRGNVEAIVDGVYPADAEHLGTVLEETRVLSRLIEDLRTLSLAEAGTLALHLEPTDLSIVAAEVGDPSSNWQRPRARPSTSTWPTTCRCWTSTRSASGKSWRTWSPTRCGTQAPMAPSGSVGGRPRTRCCSRSSTTGRASRPTSCPRSSTASQSRPTPAAPASGSRSRERSSKRTAAGSPPTARLAAGRQSASCFRSRSGQCSAGRTNHPLKPGSPGLAYRAVRQGRTIEARPSALFASWRMSFGDGERPTRAASRRVNRGSSGTIRRSVGL